MYSTKTYKPTIQDLDQIPLTSFTREYDELLHHRAQNDLKTSLALDTNYTRLVEDFSSKYRLAASAAWFWGQALARFACLPLSKNDNGLYSAKTLVVEHIKNDSVLRALHILSRYSKRSSIVEKQTEPATINYCALVPIIMSAFKKLNNVPYMAWDPAEIYGITEANLADAMVVKELPEISIEKVLDLRLRALTPRTGRSAGISKPPQTTYSLTIPKESELYTLPTLAKIMLCQTWCAHPLNRTKYMVLNPLDWDDMPQPLIDISPISARVENDYSWAE